MIGDSLAPINSSIHIALSLIHIYTDQILAGAIPACILALLIDYIFSILERLVTPKSFQLAKPRSVFKGIVDKTIIVLTCLGLAGSFVYTNMGNSNSSKKIKIGSMDFSEQETLNYMLKYLIEGNSDVMLKLNKHSR